ncbi:uncharacterized protein [Ciconia boyciana]|uniref:uncharacterized protein n=1 Tax=Ciconia boyciana TaxID=52775 RepID=UPI003B9E4CF5
MSLWACDTGALAGIKGLLPEAGEHLEEKLGAAGQEFGEDSPRSCPASAVQPKAPDGGEEGAAMRTEELKEELCVLRERLARCSAESKKQKELLQRLGKKQDELQETMEQLSVQKPVVVRCFENIRQEIEQLEEWMARMKERVEVANREAAAGLEEAQKAKLFHGEAEGGPAARELIKWEPWPELREGLQEQVEVTKLLRSKLRHLLERREGLREPAALSLLLFLAFLQLAVLLLVLLKTDVLNWVLPPKLAAALGSCPARSQLF